MSEVGEIRRNFPFLWCDVSIWEVKGEDVSLLCDAFVFEKLGGWMIRNIFIEGNFGSEEDEYDIERLEQGRLSGMVILMVF